MFWIWTPFSACSTEKAGFRQCGSQRNVSDVTFYSSNVFVCHQQWHPLSPFSLREGSTHTGDSSLDLHPSITEYFFLRALFQHFFGLSLIQNLPLPHSLWQTFFSFWRKLNSQWRLAEYISVICTSLKIPLQYSPSMFPFYILLQNSHSMFPCSVPFLSPFKIPLQ